MATQSAIFIPEQGNNLSASVNATTSTAELIIGTNRIFSINASGDINIRFGNSGMGAADATYFRVPSGVTAQFDLGSYSDRIRIYNPGGSSITYWILMMARA